MFAVLVVDGIGMKSYPKVCTAVYDKELEIKSVIEGEAIYETWTDAWETAERYRQHSKDFELNASYEVVPASVIGKNVMTKPERIVPAEYEFVIRDPFLRGR